jgi:hypothetical protein
LDSKAAASARWSRVQCWALTMALTTFCDHSGRLFRSCSCMNTTQHVMATHRR